MTETKDHEKLRELTNKDYYLSLLCALLVFILFSYLGRTDQGYGMAACTAVVFMAIRNSWNLRKHLWFWIAIALVVLIQVPIVVLIPWGGKGITGRGVFPVAIADGALAYGFLKIAEFLINRGSRTSEDVPPIVES